MRYAKGIGRSILALLLVVIVLEMCARIDDVLSYGAPFWGPYNLDLLYVKDQIGLRGKPSARYQKWQLNALGYRGPELRPGAIPIVCFGASETFGLYEAEGQEYPRQLEQELNSRTAENVFEVVNVAYAGETVATAVLRVPEIVEEIHPSVAIVYPSLASYIWLPWVREAPVQNTSTPPATETLRPTLEWRIRDRLRNFLKQVLPPLVQTKLRQIEIARAAGDYPVMDRIPEESVLRFRNDLEQLIDALRKRGVEPVLVTHATEFENPLTENDRELLFAWRKFYPMLKEDGFLDMEQRMNNAMRDIATEQHIMVIDVAREMPHGKKYFADFSHFTTVGAGVMAARLADGLQSMSILHLSQATAILPGQPVVVRSKDDWRTSSVGTTSR
jgi:lysophospholipase L1-like esterase